MTRMTLALILAALMTTAAACAKDAAQTKAPETEEVAAQKVAPAEEEAEEPSMEEEAPMKKDEDCGPPEVDLSGETTTLEGVLSYEALPRTKSVAAYLGADLKLKVGEEEHVLKATEEVEKGTLEGLDGKTVKVVGVKAPAYAPCPGMGSYPQGMDGEPMKKPAAVHVVSVEEVK